MNVESSCGILSAGGGSVEDSPKYGNRDARLAVARPLREESKEPKRIPVKVSAAMTFVRSCNNMMHSEVHKGVLFEKKLNFAQEIAFRAACAVINDYFGGDNDEMTSNPRDHGTQD